MMTTQQKIKEKVKAWLFSIALKKAITRIAQVIVSYALAHNIAFSANIFGFDVDIRDTEKMTMFLVGVTEILRNYLKTKFPKYFGWL